MKVSEIVERFIESENREMKWKRFPVIRQRTICVLQAFIVCALDSFEGILNKHCFCEGGQKHRLQVDFF